jgi:hypothetical protein
LKFAWALKGRDRRLFSETRKLQQAKKP